MTNARFTTTARDSHGGPYFPQAPPSKARRRATGVGGLRANAVLALVERGVDLRDLLGLPGRVRLGLVVQIRLAAEVEAERPEVDAAAVGADLLERREQRLALVRLLGHLLGRADL